MITRYICIYLYIHHLPIKCGDRWDSAIAIFLEPLGKTITVS